MPKIRYYCHLKQWEVKIYKGDWDSLQAENTRLQRETGVGLTGADSLEKAIKLCEKEAPPFAPEYVDFYDFTKIPSVNVKLTDAKEFRVLPRYFSVTTASFLEESHTQEEVLKLIDDRDSYFLESLRQEKGYSLLHYCVHHNYVTAIAKLLDKCPALLDAQDTEKGYTALHFAFELKYLDAASELLRRGADYRKRATCAGNYTAVQLLPSETAVRADQVEPVRVLSKLIPSGSSNQVTLHFGLDEAGASIIRDVEIGRYNIQGTSLVAQLAAKYPQCYVGAGAYPYTLNPGLAVRHIRSESFIARAMVAQYKGKSVDDLLAEKGLRFQHSLVFNIGKEYQEKVLDIKNVFIGCAVDNGIYGGLMPDINRAKDIAEARAVVGEAFEAVNIPVPLEHRVFIAGHPDLKNFLNAERNAFECTNIGRLRALYNLMHIDKPVIASSAHYDIPAPPVVSVPIAASAGIGGAISTATSDAAADKSKKESHKRSRSPAPGDG